MDRQRFLSKSKRRYKTLALPDGDAVTIQSLTGAEMRTFRESLVNKKGDLIQARGDKLNELLLVRCLVGDDQQTFLNDADAMGGALDDLDGAIVMTLAEQCKTWTGFKSDGDFSEIEAAIKNSEDDRENFGSDVSPPLSVESTLTS